MGGKLRQQGLPLPVFFLSNFYFILTHVIGNLIQIFHFAKEEAEVQRCESFAQ
jgi:hypothetical protein